MRPSGGRPRATSGPENANTGGAVPRLGVLRPNSATCTPHRPAQRHYQCNRPVSQAVTCRQAGGNCKHIQSRHNDSTVHGRSSGAPEMPQARLYATDNHKRCARRTQASVPQRVSGHCCIEGASAHAQAPAGLPERAPLGAPPPPLLHPRRPPLPPPPPPASPSTR